MPKKMRSYEGEQITVTYDAARCIHARECVRRMPAVFDPDKRPWVQPDAAAADDIAEVVRRCPTGALYFRRRDGGPPEPVPATNTITAAPDGPLYVHGDIEIAGGGPKRETRVALCRCGASKNKPFCDDQHAAIGFRDPGELGEGRLRPGTPEGDDRCLRVTLAPNGPLLLDGPVDLRSGDGRAAVTGIKGALCRCGRSATKPYCDGTHREIGFDSE